jgi:hypothetical protein
MSENPENIRPLPERIVATYTAPRRLLPDFREGTRWLDVLIISTAIALLSVYLLPESFFVEQMRDAVTRRGDPVDITSSPAEIARWGRYLGMLTALVSHPLFALALAGVLSLIVTIMGDGVTGFRDHLSISSHAFLIPALGALLAIPLQWITGDPEARFTTALFLPDSASLPLLVLNGLDAFSVWMLVVIGIWVGELNPRIGAARMIGILLGVYLILNVITAMLVS